MRATLLDPGPDRQARRPGRPVAAPRRGLPSGTAACTLDGMSQIRACASRLFAVLSCALLLLLAGVDPATAQSPGRGGSRLGPSPGPRDPGIERAWRRSLAQRLEAGGATNEAARILRFSTPEGWFLQRAGQMGMALRRHGGGLRVESLFDLRTSDELAAATTLPLFSLTLRPVGGTNETLVDASQGWNRVAIRPSASGFEVRFEQPTQAELAGLGVTLAATGESATDSFSWRLRVDNPHPAWTLWRVHFPQVAVTNLGEAGAVCFPRGPGEVQSNAWARSYQYGGNYPGGWCSMQWLAAYRPGPTNTGLYLGLHDPWGSTKDLRVEGDAGAGSLALRFEHPVPDMGRGRNGYELPGPAVWRLLRGDWYDAAQIYKAWVRTEAKWWPRTARVGRPDTPAWMRQLNVWVMTGGAPGECVAPVQRFRQALGQPVGFHWYNWHQIPFDNDYPHYFPAREGFPQAVGALQAAQVFVMPYINGRLWDSKDRGPDDFEFSRRALFAATKQADGKPYLESYGSKESNGEPVRLAAMCPATPLWQETVAGIVQRLVRDVGTRGVYIDQVAAAAPTLCLDPNHRHPLGGGHWWNEGYWQMLTAIRQRLPPDAMLTTECNGEPFISWFDGYLTWHWQYDGQVPAFPAVYGGTIQMFGRAYRGGATKDLALRMKAGQQLVFGEQLGWLDPALVDEPANFAFFRQLAQLRARFNRYFVEGDLARPPRLVGAVPTVRADWQWSGEWWVTTDAVLTGAWQLSGARGLTLFFVNVSDQPLDAMVAFDPAAYGLRALRLRCVVTEARDTGLEVLERQAGFGRPARFAPRSAQAWELTW